MLRRVLAVSGAVALTVMLTGCATHSTSQQPPSDMTIHGKVTSAPTCPVETIGSPCPARPASGVLVEVLRGQNVVATTHTDPDGQYLMRVLVGDYDLRATMQRGYPGTVTKHVTAKADVTADLVLDSGLR